MENAQEWLCLIKTREELFNKVETAIKKLHSYETPEIIAVPIIKGSKEYLIWLDDELHQVTITRRIPGRFDDFLPT